MKSITGRLLLGRFLTRSGDQAWDFAVPIVLLKIFPDQLRLAAFYFFLIRLALVFLLPRMASWIDRIKRSHAAQIGIFAQLFGVVIGAFFIFMFTREVPKKETYDLFFMLNFAGLVLAGICSSLGSNFMDIAIANDLVPAGVEEKDLGSFNGRIRQIDLATEVGSPVVAGLLLTIDTPFPYFGFFLVALWNIISFVPEFLLLTSIFKDRKDLSEKSVRAADQLKVSFWKKITLGWAAFFKQPVALAALSYAFLWLSVLSPHGVLLTAFLKDSWHVSEVNIAIFRGAGAFFGLLATFLYPKVIKKLGLVLGTRNFLFFQACVLVISLYFFLGTSELYQFIFLILILFSRVGIYGFSLGEMQIRQVGIQENVRGEVNGFASSLTGVMTLILYGVGALLPKTSDFQYLVFGSVFFVVFASVLFSVWTKRPESRSFQ